MIGMWFGVFDEQNKSQWEMVCKELIFDAVAYLNDDGINSA